MAMFVGESTREWSQKEADLSDQNRALQKELRFARKIIRKMKKETNEFDEARAVANKALRRLRRFFEEHKL